METPWGELQNASMKHKWTGALGFGRPNQSNPSKKCIYNPKGVCFQIKVVPFRVLNPEAFVQELKHKIMYIRGHRPPVRELGSWSVAREAPIDDVSLGNNIQGPCRLPARILFPRVKGTISELNSKNVSS